MNANKVANLLGEDSDYLLSHMPRQVDHPFGPDFVDRIFGPSDRNIRTLGHSNVYSIGADSAGQAISSVDQGIDIRQVQALLPTPNILIRTIL